MKGKKLSKALAFLLAVVMVFTTLPMFAFAEEETATTPYVVSYGAPAVLMNENTWVDLSDIYVEMDAQGTTVSGADITWSAAKQDGITFNAAKKLVNAKAAGKYKLVATANGVAKNVWVIVKKAEETEFTLVDYDFTVDKYDPTEWNLVYYASDGGGKVGTAKATDGSNPAYFTNNSGKANGYIYVGPNNGAELNSSGGKIWVNDGVLVNNNPIFKDFADYTVVSTALSVNNIKNDWTGIGPVARVMLTDEGKFDAEQNSILSFVMRNSTVRIQSHRGSWWANGIKTYEGTLVNKGSENEADKFLWYDKTTYHKTTGVFDGDNVQLYFDDTKLFDLSAATDSVKTNWAKDTNYAVKAGYPGVWAYGGGARIRTFTVKLNDNTLAPTTEVVSNAYKVSDAAPAIPMTAGKAVLLSEIEVNFDGVGYVALADTKITIADETKLTVSGDYLIAFAEGTHKIAVKYGDETKTVWVVAANETDAANNQYYLLNETFDNGTYDPDEWGVKVIQKDINTAYYLKDDGTRGSTDYARGKWYDTVYYQNGIFVDATSFTQQEVTELPATGAQSIIYKLTEASGNYEAGLYAWHFGQYLKANEVTSTDGATTKIHYYAPAVYAYNYADAISNQLLYANAGMPARYGAVIPFRTSKLKTTNVYDVLLDANGNVAYKEDGITPVDKATDFSGTGFFYSKNPIFNDFSDYTLETSTALVERGTYAPGGSVNAAFVQIGPVARLTYNDSRVNDYASFNISYRWANSKTVYYAYAKGSQNPSSDGVYGTFTALTTDSWNINTVLGPTEYYWGKKDEVFIISKMVASGNTVKLEKFENRAGTAPSTPISFTQETTVTNKGTVGVLLRHEGAPAIDYIKVTLNADILAKKPDVYDIPTYTVTNSSPAIPMNAMTKVNMIDLSFEIDDIVVNGNAVKLTLKQDTDSVIIGNDSITAYKKGVYAATLTYEDIEKTVYIVVKNQDEKEWVLYEQTFGDYSAATTENPMPIPDGWAAQAYSTENYHDASIRYSYVDFENVRPYATSNNTFTGPGVVPISKYRDITGLSMYAAPAFFTLNDSVVNDFADYTISSNMVIYSNAYYCGHTSNLVGAGLFGRAEVTDNGKLSVDDSDFTAIIVDPASKTVDGVAKGLYVSKLKMNSKATTGSNAKRTLTAFKEDDANVRWSYLNGKTNQEIALTLKYDGTTATLSSSADAESRTFTADNLENNRGAVGVAVSFFDDSGQATAVNVKTFKVALNNSAGYCPTYSELSIYKVDNNTPVVPMTAHSYTNLANVMVEFGDDLVLGSAAEWTSLDEQLVFSGSKVTVYGAGTYTAKATYKGINKTIYFVVKNKDDANYVVYGADFDRTVGNDWTLYNSSFAVLDKTDVYNDTSNYEMFNGFKIAQNNYMMLDNEVIRNLRDYTMSVEVGGNYEPGAEDWRAFYLIGRADTLTPTADFNTAMVGFMPRAASTPIRLFYKNNAYNVNCKDTAAEDYIYTVGDLVEVSVKLNNKQVVATIDGVEIYDTLKDSSYSADKRDRLPVTGGNVGIKTSMSYSIKHYEVRLNAETVENAPECVALSDVVTDTIYMTAGTRLAFSDVKLVFGNETVAGDKAKWSYVRNNTMEVSDFFDTVCAFTAGTENITVTYNDKTINITIIVEAAKSANTYPVLTSMIETDGNGTAVITPVADDNYAYQIAVTPKSGYVVDTENSYVYSYKTTVKMLGRTNDSTGNTLVADFDALDDVVVNLSFKAEKAADITMIGSTIRYANEETGVTNGIRFGMRSYNVKNARIDTIIVDGVEYNVVGVGMVMLPKPLLEGELTVDTKYAATKIFSKVVDCTENYADFALVLTNMSETYLTMDIASRGFIKYEISDGNYGYYYADEMTRSYNSVEKAIYNADLKYDFYYSDFDKGYVTMVYDDYRGDLGTVFNIFQEYNIPLVAAIPPETVTSDSKAVLLRNIQAAGGEIIGHHFGVLTSAWTAEEKYTQLKTTYDVLTGYGLNVNGYILAGGTNQGDIDHKEIETMLRKIGFSYSDLYGISPNYYHPRSSMATSNDSTVKKNITTVGNNKKWISFYAHDLQTERTADELRELIEYIQANPDVEIVTYRYLYQNFGNFRNPVNWNNGVTQ